MSSAASYPSSVPSSRDSRSCLHQPRKKLSDFLATCSRFSVVKYPTVRRMTDNKERVKRFVHKPAESLSCEGAHPPLTRGVRGVR